MPLRMDLGPGYLIFSSPRAVHPFPAKGVDSVAPCEIT